MIKIYRMFSPNQLSYIGSTKREISIRFSEHKSHAFSRTWGLKGLLQTGRYKIKDIKIELLEKCSKKEQFSRELFWMKKFKNINRCLPSVGPLGFKPTKDQIKMSSKAMSKRWATERYEMLKRVNANKTRAFQKMASSAGHKSKYLSLPLMEAIDPSGKNLGTYKTKKELSEILGVSKSTAGRYVMGRLKIGKLYTFRRVSQSQ